MIYWDQPIRLKSNGQQVYVVGDYYAEDWVIVGVENRFGSGGIPFDQDGDATGSCPPHWNQVENFDPLAQLLSEAKHDPTPSQRLRSLGNVESVRDNPLFGMF